MGKFVNGSEPSFNFLDMVSTISNALALKTLLPSQRRMSCRYVDKDCGRSGWN